MPFDLNSRYAFSSAGASTLHFHHQCVPTCITTGVPLRLEDEKVLPSMLVKVNSEADAWARPSTKVARENRITLRNKSFLLSGALKFEFNLINLNFHAARTLVPPPIHEDTAHRPCIFTVKN